VEQAKGQNMFEIVQMDVKTVYFKFLNKEIIIQLLIAAVFNNANIAKLHYILR